MDLVSTNFSPGFSSTWGFQNLLEFFFILFAGIIIDICSSVYFHLTLHLLKKFVQMFVHPFSILEDFPKNLLIWKMLQLFPFSFSKSPSEVFSVRIFSRNISTKTLPTLKIGKKFSRCSAWSGLHKMAVILIHVK